MRRLFLIKVVFSKRGVLYVSQMSRDCTHGVEEACRASSVHEKLLLINKTEASCLLCANPGGISPDLQEDRDVQSRLQIRKIQSLVHVAEECLETALRQGSFVEHP